MPSRSRLRHPARIAIAVAAIALLASACSNSATSTNGKGYIAGKGVIEQIPAAKRVALPAITGKTLDGDTLDSRDYRGKVIVVNLWGSWCPPCRAEAPALRRVWEENRSKGVQFIGIDIRDNDAAAMAFERRYKITYPSIRTNDAAQAVLAFGSMLPLNAIPSTLVTDKQGRVAARVIGRSTYVTLSDLVKSALKEKE